MVEVLSENSRAAKNTISAFFVIAILVNIESVISVFSDFPENLLMPIYLFELSLFIIFAVSLFALKSKYRDQSIRKRLNFSFSYALFLICVWLSPIFYEVIRGVYQGFDIDIPPNHNYLDTLFVLVGLLTLVVGAWKIVESYEIEAA